ncbi:MAG: PHB depolymerase family esterase [Rhodobacteraceae bacterium]|nr:MAG: PHB depolymerase family esterase [Paracoccaceae bacterium]
MTDFNIGAWRPVDDDARSARLTAANDLVQQTLARHGLVPPQGGAQAPQAKPGFPAMDAVLQGLGQMPGATPVPAAPLPPGAAFRDSRFTCAAGSRGYRTYVPSTAAQGVSGLVVMLHGCTQTPEDFALGTGMNALAERHGFVVVYPQQSRGENAQSCWNWFSLGDQRRDRGEPAIIAGLTREVGAEFQIGEGRIFVAGLSAGAAMAVILGETYPEVFAAVGAHSGLPFGAAKDVPSAFAAMSNGATRTAALPGTPVRTIVFHGSADAVVHPANGDHIVRDVLQRLPGQTLQTEDRGTAANRSFTRRVTSGADGISRLEHWTIDGLGHAWSGGNPAGSHAVAEGPDASAELVRFFFQTDTGA